MRVFFDTSALAKLFVPEAGTDEMNAMLAQDGMEVWVSTLTPVCVPSRRFAVMPHLVPSRRAECNRPTPKNRSHHRHHRPGRRLPPGVVGR